MWAECAELTVTEADRLFFCGQGQSRLASKAKAICAVCEVQGDCLEFALRYPEETEFGVWGGTTPGGSVGGCAACRGDMKLISPWSTFGPHSYGQPRSFSVTRRHFQ
jgi:hypothetical protein